MQAIAAQTSQVNTRVDSSVKAQAEAVLELMGSSTAELVRSVFGKVARGSRDYEELAGILSDKSEAAPDSLLADGWAASEAYYRTIGVDQSTAKTPERSWDELYAEAMDAHFSEKGLIV